MSVVARHILLPALAPGLIVGLYFTPVALIGCVNCGLIALAVALVSLVAGIVIAVVALRSKRDGRPESSWQALSAAILAIPALLLLGPLG